MKSVDRLVCAAVLISPLLLAGCNILPTTRHLPVPKAPTITRNATPEQLAAQLNQRWEALNTLTATVEIYATGVKTEQGIATDYPSCRGFILMRKPQMLRVAGTYFGVKIFDMTSNGSRFTLVMPTKNLVIEGSNKVTEKSANQWENLRPDFFLDALAVHGMEPEDEYMATSDTVTVEDAAKKHLYAVPEYVLDVVRRKAASQELRLVRKVTFHRDDLLPYEQDDYDSNGNLETQVFYSSYTDFSGGKYPTKVTIMRPQEGIQLVLTVERVEENVDLPDSQFKVDIPDNATIRKLK
jgi:outer membrane lipoprotein-sorting protein